MIIHFFFLFFSFCKECEPLGRGAILGFFFGLFVFSDPYEQIILSSASDKNCTSILARSHLHLCFSASHSWLCWKHISRNAVFDSGMLFPTVFLYFGCMSTECWLYISIICNINVYILISTL